MSLFKREKGEWEIEYEKYSKLTERLKTLIDDFEICHGRKPTSLHLTVDQWAILLKRKNYLFHCDITADKFFGIPVKIIDAPGEKSE